MKSQSQITSAVQSNLLIRLSILLNKRLGTWKVFFLFLAISIILFGYFVPHGIEIVTNQRKIAPKILDEYIMTWTPEIARNLFMSLGASGRLAYQHFYLHLDFWVPVLSMTICFISLLSKAFPINSRFQWLNLLPIFMWFFDIAENVNHYYMAGLYPQLPEFSLTYGPWFTYFKYLTMFIIPVVAIIGFFKKKIIKQV